jgi:hypothetical protein
MVKYEVCGCSCESAVTVWELAMTMILVSFGWLLRLRRIFLRRRITSQPCVATKELPQEYWCIGIRRLLVAPVAFPVCFSFLCFGNNSIGVKFVSTLRAGLEQLQSLGFRV